MKSIPYQNHTKDFSLHSTHVQNTITYAAMVTICTLTSEKLTHLVGNFCCGAAKYVHDLQYLF